MHYRQSNSAFCIIYVICMVVPATAPQPLHHMHCLAGRLYGSTNYLLVVPNHLVKISSYLPFSCSFFRAALISFKSSSFFLDTAIP